MFHFIISKSKHTPSVNLVSPPHLPSMLTVGTKVSRSRRGKGGTNNINNGSVQEMMMSSNVAVISDVPVAAGNVPCERDVSVLFKQYFFVGKQKKREIHYLFLQLAFLSAHISFVAMLSSYMKDLSLCWQRYSHMFYLVNGLASPGLCRTLSK